MDFLKWYYGELVVLPSKPETHQKQRPTQSHCSYTFLCIRLQKSVGKNRVSNHLAYSVIALFLL